MTRRKQIRKRDLTPVGLAPARPGPAHSWGHPVSITVKRGSKSERLLWDLLDTSQSHKIRIALDDGRIFEGHAYITSATLTDVATFRLRPDNTQTWEISHP